LGSFVLQCLGFRKMKTIQISIIIGVGTVSVSIAVILMVALFSSHSDETGITIIKLKDEYGVGEPISFFVDVKNTIQNNLYPISSIVNEQNQVLWSTDDLPPNGNTSNIREYLIQESSENVPIINQTGKYTLIVSYGDKKAEKDFAITELINENGNLHFYGSYKLTDEKNGLTDVANKSYFFTTVHATPSALTSSINGTTTRFHDVIFIFPSSGGLTIPNVGNPPYYVQVKFPDNVNETLEIRANMWSTVGPPMDFHEYFPNGTKVFPNGTIGTWKPMLHKDQIVTTLSLHTNPRAGITVTHDSVTFLVSLTPILYTD